MRWRREEQVADSLGRLHALVGRDPGQVRFAEPSEHLLAQMAQQRRRSPGAPPLSGGSCLDGLPGLRDQAG
jgi:hypothetical protein